jgi:3-hydroxybutyryl-CoA dehydrogenase
MPGDNRMQCIGIVGSGPMGTGIAQSCITAGLDVVLTDISEPALARARSEIGQRLGSHVSKGRMRQADADAAIARLATETALEKLAPCDLVIEAIVERIEPKQELFSRLEGIVSDAAILASNTSSLSVSEIAAVCRLPGRVAGLHFFNPVPLMKLVEVIAGLQTDQAIIARLMGFVDSIGKVALEAKDRPGFLVNLQGRAYILEALAVTSEGVADYATIDRIMTGGMGFRMGPFALMDLTGIDINFAASSAIYEGFQHDPRLRTVPLHAQMARAGLLGRKTGKGFYTYPEATVPPTAEPAAAPLRPAMQVTEQDAQQAERLAQVIGDDDTKSDVDAIALVAPLGEDCATVCARQGLDPSRTVALDLTGAHRKFITVMAAIGGADAARIVAAWLAGQGFSVEIVGDSPGFVAQRIVAMIGNLGCELAQTGTATPEAIDLAMKLAQNYPLGPIEMIEHLGVRQAHQIMRNLQAITGSDRYRPSLWLRRRDLLCLNIREPDVQ